MASNPDFFLKLIFIINFLLITCRAQIPHRQFQYKYSFKGPYLAQKDGTVPFWEYEGSTIASEEMVRITPSLKSKKGSIWSKNQTNFQWWEVELVFRINGRGRLGADGLSFWYTEHRGEEGPTFGSNDQWNGLGLFFDSFDNDGKGNNPYIMAMINDGTKVYDHQSDGMNQQLTGCQRDFRNKPFPVRAKIEYYKNILSVLFHSGNTNNENDYELCLRAENIFLPQFGHFGMSAATGALADDHDVLKFLTTSLHPPGSEPTLGNIGEADKEKFAKEYEQYKEKLERQKEEYRKQHPDEAREREGTDDEFESQQQLELKQIFNGQSQMFDVLKSLHRKMDEVIGREERVLSMLSNSQVGGVGGQPLHPPGQQQVHPGQQPPSGSSDSIRRHEIEAILGNQREMVQSLRDVRAFVTEIHQRSQSILALQNKPQNDNLVNEIREQYGGLKRDLASLAAKTESSPCPVIPPVNCVSPMIFIFSTAFIVICLLGYQVYKGNKESQSKKFY